MDRSRTDPEGARAVQPNRRISKLAVVVAVQNLLLVVCLLVTFYVYRDFQANKAEFLMGTSEDLVHIRLAPIQPTSWNATVQFRGIISKYLMDLNDKKNQISIQCTGFYIWHVQMCYTNLTKTGVLHLHLQATGSETPVSSFKVDIAHEVCRGLHSVIYLKKNQLASMNLFITQGFKIRNMTVDMSYLWGNMCDY